MKQSTLASLLLLLQQQARLEASTVNISAAAAEQQPRSNARKRRRAGDERIGQENKRAGEEVTTGENNINNNHDKDDKRRLRGGRRLQQEQATQQQFDNHEQNNRQLVKSVSSNYLTQNPYYPSHDLQSCLNDGNPPSWMTWEGGYAEAHLFDSLKECCERWFPEVSGCLGDDEVEGVVDAIEGNVEGGEYNNEGNIMEGGGVDWGVGNVVQSSSASVEINSSNNYNDGQGTEQVLSGGSSSTSGINVASGTNVGPSAGYDRWNFGVEGSNGGGAANNGDANNNGVAANNNGGGAIMQGMTNAVPTLQSLGSGPGGDKDATHTVYSTTTSYNSNNNNYNNNNGGGGDKYGSVNSLSNNDNNNNNDGRPLPTSGGGGGVSSFDHLTIVQPEQSALGSHWQIDEDEEEEEEQSRGHGAPLTHDQYNEPVDQTTSSNHISEKTFPTSSCGTGWLHASECSLLCLSGNACPSGQSCYPGVHCPASQVAAAMGQAGATILDMVTANEELEGNAIPTNVCGVSYTDAESKCRAGPLNDEGEATLGFAADFESCENGLSCPPLNNNDDGGEERQERHCYGGILCPPPPTISPAPTRAPIPQYDFVHSQEGGGHGKSIVAYYAAWQYYDRSKLAQPLNLNYDMVTRINYAFFQTDEEGYLFGTDDYADAVILFGDVEEDRPGEVCTIDGASHLNYGTVENADGCKCHLRRARDKVCNFHQLQNGLVHLAHAKGVEVYVSIGGWTLSDAFVKMASTREGREQFAKGCVELILEYGFDGIDIDWEYPGYTPHSGTSADRENFVLLLQTLRSALDALGTHTNQRYGLTAALPCGPSNIANGQDIPAVAEILDELNLMTYDFHGSWDKITGHNAPLFDQPRDLESGWSVHGCVENWVGSNSPDPLKKAHRQKVNVGLPFYGRSYLDTTQLYRPHGGNDKYSWYEDDGTPQYFNIKAKLDSGEMTSVRDDDTKTPYAYFNDGYGMVSYDDERSICDKTEYVVEEGLGGFIIWDISGDMMDDFHQPLLEALNRKLALPETICKASFGVVQDFSDSNNVLSETEDVMIPMDEPEEPTIMDESEEPMMMMGVMVIDERPLSQPAEVTRPLHQSKPLLVDKEPIVRGDKAEVVGISIAPPPSPRPKPPAPRPVPVSSLSASSPYTLDKSTFGPLAVAAEMCTGGCPSGSTCVGNSASGQLIKDEECTACGTGQTWWPCDVQGLCWCWADGTDRIAPAPGTGMEAYVPDSGEEYYTVCDDILSREMFDTIAPNAREPYTYEGLCDAILSYNAHHTEKIFGMGDLFQRTAELAAFLGNTLHESDEFKAGREYLMCADHKIVDGKVYCKPCDPGSFDWANMVCNHSLISGTSDFNEYCQPSSKPPEACHCGNGVGAADRGMLEGYVAASYLFFGRGAIQLSWNYNYIGASVALTGSPDTFCDDPDVVATEGRYAWGAGIYFWMEHVKEGTTSHMEALKDGGDFGGTLNNINGGLECPAHGGWHVDAVKMRLNRYCRAARALGLPNLMRLDNCAGFQEAMHTCLGEGKCDDCLFYEGKTTGEHVKNFALPAAPVPAASVEMFEPEPEQFEPEPPLCPPGLTPWSENPDCCVPNANFIGDGACDPDFHYNTAQCGYDGGDCCKDTCNTDSSAFGCTTKEGTSFGKYGPFGFYCLDPSQGDGAIDPFACDVDEKYRIGDGRCDPAYNTEGCNYDGGDCCEETCDEMFSYYSCGSGVYSYQCADPRYKVDTNQPTEWPTPKPTRMPTNRPIEDDIYTPPDSFIGDDGILMTMCPMDMLECPNGSFKGRNPNNGCAFDPCPQPKEDEVMEEQSASASDEVQVKCKSNTLKECPNGKFVERDPSDNCRYFPCSEVDGKEELSTSTTSSSKNDNPLANSISSALHGKNNNVQNADFEENCNDDTIECGRGIFVGRNPDNLCKFYACPPAAQDNDQEEEDSSMEMSLAAAIGASMSQTQPQCNDDVKECPDGSFVGRNLGNGCKYYKCPDNQQAMAASISSQLGAKHGECDDGLMRCPNGSFVSRDPDDKCRWFPCPTATSGSSSGSGNSNMAASISASFGQKHECSNEVARCPDGSFVARNPDDGCQYFPCPVANTTTRRPTPRPTPRPNGNNDNIVSMASAVHGKYNSNNNAAARAECTSELHMCADGHYVGQDPDDGCNWYPCTFNGRPTPRPTSKPAGYGMNTLSGCTKDLWRCSDGSFVGRDRDNGCDFFDCPDAGGSSMQQMTSSLSSLKHSKEAEEKTAPVQYSDVQVHQKKRNSG